jgi:RNA polymerase I-specific transcription initiation factor RRN3
MVSIVPNTPSVPLSTKQKPVKPLLRRSTLSGSVRKSDDAGLDADFLSVPPSPKKQKHSVTFSSQVEERVMDNYRSLDSVKGEVRRAIEAHQRGDSEGFEHIKEIFTPRRKGDDDGSVDQVEMRQYLLALTNSCSSLGRNCKGLVATMLACEWMGRDEIFVKSYLQFLGSLVSAQGIYVGSVLGMLVEHFLGGRTILLAYTGALLTLCSADIQRSSAWLPRCQPRATLLKSACCLEVPPSTHSLGQQHPFAYHQFKISPVRRHQESPPRLH